MLLKSSESEEKVERSCAQNKSQAGLLHGKEELKGTPRISLHFKNKTNTILTPPVFCQSEAGDRDEGFALFRQKIVASYNPPLLHSALPNTRRFAPCITEHRADTKGREGGNTDVVWH